MVHRYVLQSSASQRSSHPQQLVVLLGRWVDVMVAV
jgi:hypothetical protein